MSEPRLDRLEAVLLYELRARFILDAPPATKIERALWIKHPHSPDDFLSFEGSSEEELERELRCAMTTARGAAAAIANHAIETAPPKALWKLLVAFEQVIEDMTNSDRARETQVSTFKLRIFWATVPA